MMVVFIIIILCSFVYAMAMLKQGIHINKLDVKICKSHVTVTTKKSESPAKDTHSQR